MRLPIALKPAMVATVEEIAEPASHGKAILRFARDNPDRPAPDPCGLASGEEAEQVEAVEVCMEHNPAAALGPTIEPIQRGGFESLA
jgi:hypothetical protein